MAVPGVLHVVHPGSGKALAHAGQSTPRLSPLRHGLALSPLHADADLESPLHISLPLLGAAGDRGLGVGGEGGEEGGEGEEKREREVEEARARAASLTTAEAAGSCGTERGYEMGCAVLKEVPCGTERGYQIACVVLREGTRRQVWC
eukprot:3377497-Rhodomonas_salina.1